MSGTIQYDDNGAIDPEASKPKGDGYRESDDHVADPTAMSGTLETSGTSGTTETAADVSPVFEVADEQAQDAPEGTVLAPEPDPAATGEDSLTPNYEEASTAPGTDAAEAKDEDEAKKEFGPESDPEDFTVEQVQTYLDKDDTDEDERKRVLAAEKKGKKRKGLLEG